MSSNAPYGYDPMTGKPRTAPAGSEYGQSTGGSSTGNNYGQSTPGGSGAGNNYGQSAAGGSGAGNSAAPYGYDPMTGKPRTAPAGSEHGQSTGGSGAGDSYGQSAAGSGTGNNYGQSAPGGSGAGDSYGQSAAGGSGAGNSAAPYGYDPMTGKPRTAPAGSEYGQSTGGSGAGNNYGQSAAGGNSAGSSYGQSTAGGSGVQSSYGQSTGTESGYGAQPGVGEPAGNAPKGRGGNGGGRRTGIIACIAAIVVGCCVLAFAAVSLLTGGSSGKKGDGVFPTEVENTLDAIAERDEAAAFMQNLSDSNDAVGVSISADDMSTLLSSFGMDSSVASLLGISGNIEAAVSGSDLEASFSAEVTIAGQTCTMEFYFDIDEILIRVPEVLDDTYQIDLKNIESDLAASIFYPSSGSDYSLSESDYNEILELISEYDDAAERIRDGAVIVSDLEYYIDNLEDENLMPEFEKGSADVTVGGETVSCTTHTAEVSASALADILEYTEEYITETYGEAVTEMLEEQLDIDISDLSELAATIEEQDVGAVIEYDVKDNYMVRLDMKLANSETTLETVIDFGADPANSDEIVLDVYQNGETIAELTLAMASDSSGSSYTLTYAEGSGAASCTLLSYTRDNAAGSFSLSIMGTVGLSGTAVIEDKTMTISGLSATYGAYSLDLSDFKIVCTEGADISKPDGDAVNLLALSQAELEALAEEAYSNIEALYTGMTSSFY